MKIFEKVKKPNGAVIYLFGVKVLKYKTSKKRKWENNIDFYKSLGVKIGKNTRFIISPHADDHPNFGSEPFLIEIGEDCLISFGVTFLTHDGSMCLYRKISSDKKTIGRFGKIKIGNNVFIGCHSIIMPNVSIGNNVVVGAGSVVTRNIPDGEVWAGNPAKFIKSTEEYIQKCLDLSGMPEQIELNKFVLMKKQGFFSGESDDERVIKLFGIKVLKYRRYHKKEKFPCDIFNLKDLVAKGTKFPHLLGIVVSRAATIGNNCIIYQNVTIGAKSYELGNGDPINYPILGDNVTIYAGAVIVGHVKIGNNAIIGANSVVISDVPENAVVAGNPARLIKYIEDDDIKGL